jgi:hypothetical protein
MAPRVIAGATRSSAGQCDQIRRAQEDAMNRIVLTRSRIAVVAALLVVAGAAIAVGTRPAAAQAPPVVDTGGPYIGVAGVPMTFRATAMTSVPIIKWTWNFGDGTTGDGHLVQHTYATVGTFSVTLTVITNNGQTTTATTTASVGTGVVGAAFSTVTPYVTPTYPYITPTYPFVTPIYPYPFVVPTYPFVRPIFRWW